MDLEKLFSFVNAWFSNYGYWAIFFGSLIEITPLGWMVPGGGILLVAGYLSRVTESVTLVPTLVTGVLGSWTALLLAYFLGQKTGPWLAKKLRQEHNVKIAEQMLENHGGMILTTSMLANLTRFWISFVAGIEKYNFAYFGLFSLISSTTWVLLMTMAGYFAGYEQENLKNTLNGMGLVAWFFLIVSILVLVKYLKIERHKFFQKENSNPH